MANRLRNLTIVIIAACCFLQFGPINAADKIKDIKAHLKQDKAYQSASTLDKLKTLNELIKEKRTSSYDKDVRVVREELIAQYMTEKGKKDPKARLEAFAELKSMADYKKPLQYVGLNDTACAGEFAIYLSSLKDYEKASPKEKIKILKSLKDKGLWSKEFGQDEMDNAVKAYLLDETTGLKPEKQGIAGLKIIGKLNTDKVVQWGGLLSTIEKEYLAKYMLKDPEFVKASPMDKIKLLKKLCDDKLITSFLRSDAEAPIVVWILLKDKKFMDQDDAAKSAQINKMYTDRIIHMFSKDDIHRMLGVKEAKK